MLARSVVARRAESSLMTAGLVGLAVLVLASVAILQVEQDPSSNIRSADDALWWAVSTMTTVGYGDVYPVTPEGRLVGAGLMVVGVGLLGVFTAFLASRFVKSEEAELGRQLGLQLDEVRREIAELREIVEKGFAGQR
jgi:voltage-gated potassium channel